MARRWIITRSICHLGFLAILLSLDGYYFANDVFPTFFPAAERMTGVLVGMASVAIFVAVPAIAGLGLRAAIKIVEKEPLQFFAQESKTLFDVLAFSQYLTIAVVLLVIAAYL